MKEAESKSLFWILVKPKTKPELILITFKIDHYNTEGCTSLWGICSAYILE